MTSATHWARVSILTAALLTGSCAHTRTAPPAASDSGTITGQVVSRTGVFLGFGIVNIPAAHIGTVADQLGCFTIIKVPPGTHTVSCKNVGFARMQIEGVEIRPGQTTHLAFVMNEVPVTCPPRWAGAPRPDPGVDPKRTATIEGTVFDSGGSVLAAVSVVAIPLQTVGLTDSEGRFRLPGLTPGKYTVLVRKAGLVMGERRDIRVKAGRTTTLDVRLEGRP